MHAMSPPDAAAIRAITEALRTAVNAGDVAGILACWAPDGVLMPPHHPAVHGHEAIARYFQAVFAVRRLTFTFPSSALTMASDLAVERLAYRAAIRPLTGGPVTEDVGKGLHVYARRPGGRWHLAQDLWSSDLPR